MDTYYSLPLDVSRLFSGQGGEFEKCGELESIDRFLALLLMTRRGEHGFDRDFGTRLWELDFGNVPSLAEWEKLFVDYVREAVQNHEKRLRDIEVRIDVRDVLREEAAIHGKSIRKRVEVIILATLVSTGRYCGFRHILFMGPLSKD